MTNRKTIKITTQELLYLCFLIVMLFAKGIGLYDGQALYEILLVVAFVMIAVKMCITEYTLKEWLLILMTCLLVAMIYLNCKEKGIVICTLVVLAMKDVSIQRVFKVGMWTWGVVMCSNILYHLINLKSSGYKVHEKLGLGHIFRWDLGFSHPNVLHISYLVLVAFIVYNLGARYNWKKMMLLMLGNMFIFLYSVSYTGFVVSTLYLVLAWYMVARKELWKIEYIILEMVFPVCLIFSFFLVFLLPSNLFGIVNKVFNNRLILAKYYLILENIKLFGNNLEKVTTSMYTLDNAYLFSFIIYGVIMTAIIIVVYFVYIHKMVEKKKNKELAIVVCFLIAGVTEPFLFNTSFKNLTLFFIGALLWESASLKGKEKKKWTIFPQFQKELNWDISKWDCIKEKIKKISENNWKKIVFMSGILALLSGTVYGINKTMPKAYIVPRIHADVVEKDLWYLENPNDPQYEGVSILDYTDNKTYMKYFDNYNLLLMERVRLCVSSICLIWTFLGCCILSYMIIVEYRKTLSRNSY